ncbi:MAG: DHH family phosphoesterase, partial [Halobacteria archaeon]|nr:DHH family phosphoesterase [Halobacteria archaeon]
MEDLDTNFVEHARECASFLADEDDILLISHIDADGLTSAGIASMALDRAGIEHETWFSKQLDENDLEEIDDEGFETVLFTDFGSGLLSSINEYDFTPVVADHHRPNGEQNFPLSSPGEVNTEDDCEYHLNPMLFGIDGGSELSGAGTTYVLSRALGDEVAADNRDLASLAVVGAVGDMQNARDGKLTGANRVIIDEGTEAGVLETKRDLLLFGRQTRPLPKLFEYSTDVFIPGISSNSKGATEFLKEVEIELKNDGEWRTWVDLSEDEKQLVMNLLFEKCMERGLSTDDINGLVGETYTLTREDVGTELRDATEFSTLLNSTARYRRADVGFNVCKGERGETLAEARQLLRNHRRNLRNGIDYVGDNGVTKLDNVQYFDAGDEIQDTIVGIIAGMSYSLNCVDRGMPILAFADSDEDKLEVEETKVSS